MIKNIKNIIGIFCCLIIISCNDYLDVQPEDKFLEDGVFSTEGGIQNVLNGIYIEMTNINSYGGDMTMGAVEVLGQRFNAFDNGGHVFQDLANYSYNEENVKVGMDEIWASTYVNILNINKFLENIENTTTVISTEKSNLLKGEAYALRAMMHFDLLRLFGPIFSENPSGESIPYYTEASAEIAPLLSGTEVMTRVLSDLTTAESLMANDPVKEHGRYGEFLDDDVSNFYRFRYLRMNYFAVKALQARVNLYAGNEAEANAAAKVVIDQATPWFPWTDPLDVISGGGNPDRIFSKEVLFAVQNLNLYNRQRGYYDSNLLGNNILAPLTDRLEEVFESNLNDYRFNSTWIIPTVGSIGYKTFFKYADIEDKDRESRFMQPLIRISEMYYIAAETEVNPDMALSYLNTVRFNRGLIDLESGTDIDSEILKEYRKEFFGEGQLFFYYKRKNAALIPSGLSSSDEISMGSDQYVVPLPDSEIIFRNN